MKLDVTAKTLEKKMLDKKDAWTADVAAFPGLTKVAKDAIAADPAGAKTKIDELEAVVDKWDAAFKALSAPPEAAAPQPNGGTSCGKEEIITSRQIVHILMASAFLKAQRLFAFPSTTGWQNLLDTHN